MKLSKTDKKLLMKAISKHGRGNVFGSTLDKRREFNAVKKLAKLGLVENVNIVYQYDNGYQLGSQWVSGKGWNEISAKLTSKGVGIAIGLQG